MGRRRNAELGLVILAGLITVGLYALESLGGRASLPADIGPFLGVVLGLMIFAHLAVRRLAPTADPALLPLALVLNGIGFATIVRLNDRLAANQAVWTLLGVVAFVATLALVRDVHHLARYRWTIALVGLVLLVAPLVPGIGRTVNGARLWIALGPVSIQPGEFARVALTIFVASYLVEKRELLSMATRRIGAVSIPDPKHLGPVALAWAASLLVMVAERDLGSSLLLFAVFLVMVWLATGRAWYPAVGSGLFLAGAFAAWSMFEHVQARVRIWVNPWADVTGEGFQIVQGIFALASGGLTGAGPGLGSPERIPARETDFIFAVIGEELGVIGATAVLIAFILIIGAGLRTAIRSRDEFSSLLAAGLTVGLGVQAFVIIGGVLRVVPLTGITLPFVSYGGSSLLANYVLLGLLVRLSDSATIVSRSEAVETAG